MVIGEYEPYRNAPFGGRGPESLKHGNPTHKSKSRDRFQQARRRVSSRIGGICQEVALLQMGNNFPNLLPDHVDETAAKLSRSLLEKVGYHPEMKRTVKVDRVFREAVKRNTNVLFLLGSLDHYLGTNFLELRNELVKGDRASSTVRYLVCGALGVVELISNPLLSAENFVSDVSGFGTQFDGIVLGQKLPERISGSEILTHICSSGIPWYPVEYKVLFRLELAFNPNTLTKPRKEDIRFARNQLAVAMLGLAKLNHPFTMPSHLGFYYSRQPCSAKYYATPVDARFLNGWRTNLIWDLENTDRLAGREPDARRIVEMLSGSIDRLTP